MRNAIIFFGAVFILFLVLFGAGVQNKQSLDSGQTILGGQASSQLATPYASGQHLATRTPDNTIQLQGDYLWRFVYAWDGTRWEQRDLGQLLNLTRDNTAGSLSQTDNRFIIAGAQNPVSVALSQLGATSPQYLAFWSANFQNNNWCGGCDEAGNRGKWQVIELHSVIEPSIWEMRGYAETPSLLNIRGNTTALDVELTPSDSSRVFNLNGSTFTFTVSSEISATDLGWTINIRCLFRSCYTEVFPSEVGDHFVRFTLPEFLTSVSAANNRNDTLLLYLNVSATPSTPSHENTPVLVSIGERDVTFPFPARIITSSHPIKNTFVIRDTEREPTMGDIATVIGSAARAFPPTYNIANFIFQLYSPRFFDIASAAVHAGLSYRDIIRSFDGAGFLRQGIRGVLREHVEPRFVLQGLFDSGIGIDQVRQLRNEFSMLTDAQFRQLVETAGYAANEFPIFTQPRGIRIAEAGNTLYTRVHLQAVYAYLSGSPPTVMDWRDRLDTILSDVARFYEHELRGAVQVTYAIYPEPVEVISSGTNNEHELFRRIFTEGGDLYLPAFSSRITPQTYNIFVEFNNYVGGPLGYGLWAAGSSFARAVVQYFDDPVYFKPEDHFNHAKYVTAHEIGHALSFPHSWEVIGSSDIFSSGIYGGFFRNVLGNVMGYSHHADFNDAFLTDDIINLVLDGETSVLMPETVAHVDAAPYGGALSSRQAITEYITRQSFIGASDANAVEQLLAIGVSPSNIIRSYQPLERGLQRLIAAMLREGGIPAENLLIAFREAGFTSREVLSFRVFFLAEMDDISAFLEAFIHVFPPDP